MNRLWICLALLGALLVLSCGDNQEKGSASAKSSALPVASEGNGGITLPQGFGALVVADELGRGLRHLAVSKAGDIYVKVMRPKENNAILALRDQDGDGVAEQIEKFGDYPGTGIALHGEYLYASSDVAVFRYALTAGALLPEGEPELVVGGFPEQRTHEAKSFTFDDQGNIYVNVGAPSNACQANDRAAGEAGQDPCPLLELHAGVWRYDAEGLGQSHDANQRFATGLRNCVALEWDPISKQLYALQHGRDQLSGLWPELYTDEESAILPSEEFVQLNEGDDFGWPYCYNDHLQGKKVLAPEYGGDAKEVGRCAEKKDPLLAFPGHMAPNDLLFYTGELFPEKYRQGAFIAFHGSWNRAPEPQGGYFVAFVPMEDGKPAGEWEIFAEGFPQVEVVESPRDAEYRPMGLANAGTTFNSVNFPALQLPSLK
ncbi:MAG: PQQ-dependent sugar dehydrogenase, partial [Bacteroidota bacterium]